MRKSTFAEALRFVVTGGSCFLVEFLCFVALREGLMLDTLIATPIAFVVAVILNYVICIKWVFQGADSSNATKVGFMLTSIIGLFLNEGLMLLFRVLFGENQVLFTLLSRDISMYMMNKMLATLVVIIWNYFTKKAVLQSDLVSGRFWKKK